MAATAALVLLISTPRFTGAAGAAAPMAPAVRITMDECHDPIDQEFVCFGDCGGPIHPGPNAGMLQFKRHPGSCLEGDPATGVMTTAACNTTSAGQRFLPSKGLFVNGHAHGNATCITASNRSCTVYNASDPKTLSVVCEVGAPITLLPCVSDWGGTPGRLDPLQIWTKGGAYHQEESIVLVHTWHLGKHPSKHGATPNSTSCLTLKPAEVSLKPARAGATAAAARRAPSARRPRTTTPPASASSRGKRARAPV